ncbi:MAG: hypothetical protein J6M39_07320 [Lachnospiraceae bacterium]|nr:hypothetical protein [Lachnospiraceae bacterium]
MKKIIRTISSIGLVVLLSFMPCYSAIVSDNDGAAFVTKQEFEMMKDNFNAQIEQYNASLDGKIDGAIGSYLAGMNLKNADITDYWKNIQEISSNNFWISNYLSSGYKDVVNEGLSEYKSGQNVVTQRRLYYKYWSNPVHAFESLVRPASTYGCYVFSSLGNTSYNQCDGTAPNNHLAFGQLSATNGGGDVWLLSVNNTSWSADHCPSAASNVLATNTSAYSTYTNTVNSKSAGKGAGFIYHTSGAGYKFLRECSSELYTLPNINIYGHSYKNLYSTTASGLYNIYCVNTGRDDNTSLSINLGDFADSSSEISAGTEQSPTSTTNGAWASGYIDINKVTDGVDYNFIQWGKAPTFKLVTIEDTYPITQDASQTTITADSNKTTRATVYYLPSGPTTYNSAVSGVAATYRGVTLNFNDNQNWTDYTQEILTNLSGQQVKIAGGIPIVRVVSSQAETDLSLKLKFKSRSGASRNIKMNMCDAQFDNGEIAAGKQSLINGWQDVTTGTEYEYKVFVKGKDNTLFLNMYIDGADEDLITIESLEVKQV